MIIGKNTILNLYFVKRASRVSKNIGRIILEGQSGMGTGFILKNKYLLTNNHILNSYEAADKATFHVDFFIDENENFNKGKKLEIKPKILFHTSVEYNLTLVSLNDNIEHTFNSLFISNGELVKDEDVNIIHHPQGEPMQISIREGKLIEFSKSHLLYTSPTLPGSSGAPLFNDYWELIGIHESGKNLRLKDKTDNINFNGGIRINLIKSWISGLSDTLYSEIFEDKKPKQFTSNDLNPFKEYEDKDKVNNGKRDSVFISYAHKDQEKAKWHQTVDLHLKGITSIGDRKVWQDERIEAGQDWKEEIEKALSRAKVAILLIGVHFLNSTFINNEELPKLLEAAEKEGVRIFPVITHYVSYSHSVLGKFQAFNSPNKPLEYQRESGDSEKTIVELVEEIVKIFNE